MTLFDVEAAAPAAPPEPLVRVRMTVAYDGGGFRGFAAQGTAVRTVAGTLSEAMQRVLGHPIALTCAGRTDAGVHAWGQVVSFDAAADDLDLEGLQRALNKMLAPAIVVREAAPAAAGFDARRWAQARAYRYTVVNRPEPDPFRAAFAWHVEQPLDLRSLQLACDPLIGEHDFSSFCRRSSDDEVLVRRVIDARWLDLGEGILRFDVEASSFCQQMVRVLVGTMVEVGMGKRKAGDMAWVLGQQRRGAAGPPAPPRGLCLWAVRYPTEDPAAPAAKAAP